MPRLGPEPATKGPVQNPDDSEIGSDGGGAFAELATFAELAAYAARRSHVSRR